MRLDRNGCSAPLGISFTSRYSEELLRNKFARLKKNRYCTLPLDPDMSLRLIGLLEKHSHKKQETNGANPVLSVWLNQSR